MNRLELTRRRWLQAVGATSALVAGSSVFPLRRAAAADAIADPVDIGSRRELFVDHLLIDQLRGTELRLHSPQPREIVLRFDQPWEGLYCGYETVLQDGDRFRMYYRGLPVARHNFDHEVTCVVESEDGIEWKRPRLGLYDVQGTRENNVVLARSRGCHNLAPFFLDDRPDVPADQRYKAMGGTGEPGLLAFVSPDGFRWRTLQDAPVITQGAFDSQNNAFWSQSEQKYVCYFRVFRDGKRWIARAESDDFVRWSEPIDLELGGQPREHLYTNQLDPYGRAPHIYVGFPTRFFPGRRVVTPEESEQLGTPDDWNYANDCTDILLTSARGGADFQRTFLEAWIRPGLDLRNWTSRANYAARGILQTSDTELSVYIKHNAGYPTSHVRRYSLRPDGFISVNAPYAGGELITRPLLFRGRQLEINCATSAGGGVHVEVLSAGGVPVESRSLADCPEIVGDRLQHVVRWKNGSSLGELAGQPIRLRFVMRDADLYSLRFVDES